MPVGRPRLWGPPVAVALVIAVVEPLTAVLAVRTHPAPWVHDLALFGHLASLLVGFGGVLFVDWVAALWLVGKRELDDVVSAASDGAAPIWLGYAGLVLTGCLLEPDLENPVTVAKLSLVLVIGLNGAIALGIHRGMAAGAGSRTMVLAGVSGTVSQAAWWSAVVIGFVNAH